MLSVMSQLLYSLVGTANSINIRLRVSSPHGLLLWTGGREDVPNTPDHLLLGIDRGHLQVLYVISSQEWEVETDPKEDAQYTASYLTKFFKGLS